MSLKGTQYFKWFNEFTRDYNDSFNTGVEAYEVPRWLLEDKDLSVKDRFFLMVCMKI